MTFHNRTAQLTAAPRCACGGKITRATTKGFICEQCWRADELRPERVADIVKRFDDAYGSEAAAIYAHRLSDYFDAIEDAVQAQDYEMAARALRARAT